MTDSEQDDAQEAATRQSRQTGGDAPAAGSVEERESVAIDDDELFSGDDILEGEQPVNRAADAPADDREPPS